MDMTICAFKWLSGRRCVSWVSVYSLAEWVTAGVTRPTIRLSRACCPACVESFTDPSLGRCGALHSSCAVAIRTAACSYRIPSLSSTLLASAHIWDALFGHSTGCCNISLGLARRNAIAEGRSPTLGIILAILSSLSGSNACAGGADSWGASVVIPTTACCCVSQFSFTSSVTIKTRGTLGVSRTSVSTQESDANLAHSWDSGLDAIEGVLAELLRVLTNRVEGNSLDASGIHTFLGGAFLVISTDTTRCNGASLASGGARLGETLIGWRAWLPIMESGFHISNTKFITWIMN